MTIAIKILWVLLGLGLIVGAVALTAWGIPAPTGEVKITFPVEKFFSR